MYNFLIKVKYYEKDNINGYQNILFYEHRDFYKWFIKKFTLPNIKEGSIIESKQS